MEENNYRDEFELFLKESADEFKMVPSKRIWYSLYNNLHPDKKWPSMAVCLLILTAVLYIGIANNNSLSTAAKKASSENFSNILNEKNIDNKITFSEKDFTGHSPRKTGKFSLTAVQNEHSNTLNNIPATNFNNYISVPVNSPLPVINSEENYPVFKITPALASVDEIKMEELKKASQKKNFAPNVVLDNTEENNVTENIAKEEEKTDTTSSLINDRDKLLQKITQLNIEKSWKEDYAFRNKPAINKFLQNSTFSYYITPSFGYRTFSKNTESALNSSSSYLPYSAASATTATPALLDNAALNLEAGAVLQYNISKNLRLKGGVQTNYSNYVSSVTALGHPSQTSITLNNNNNNIRSSNYSTKAGNDKINKTTMQIAIPVGADYKIAGNGKLNLYVGGNIQPTYIIGGNAFVLSSDEKYYVSENSLLRKLNLNTSIETFISFKSSNGVIINFGPQVRYQLFSTYKAAYGYTEKIYNVGLKIGVTTSF